MIKPAKTGNERTQYAATETCLFLLRFFTNATGTRSTLDASSSHCVSDTSAMHPDL